MTKTVLILGASGRFGRHAARAFRQTGWAARTFDRSRDNLEDAAKDVDVIVAAWNPSYEHWAAQVDGLHKRVRQVALAVDATVILPGNVYVFGPGTGPVWDADTPHMATNPLGRIRIEMEAAYRRDGVRTIVLRAGDFLDDEASGNWFDKIMAPTLPKGILRYPGRTDIAHSWAFLPDMAHAAVALAETRKTLATFEDIPFPGYTLTGRQMAEELSKVRGTTIRAKTMAWWPLRLAWPFMPVIKHLFEMRYLWNTPHSLSGERLAQLLPQFRATPVEQALAEAINFLPETGAIRNKSTQKQPA